MGYDLDAILQCDVEDPVCFGRFRLFKHARYLEKEGVPLAVGSRTFDLLIILAERRGEVVSKAELFKRLWPNNKLVEDSALRAQVSILRKILGTSEDGFEYITNVSGRGYCFVAPGDLGLVVQTRTPAGPTSSRETLPPHLHLIYGRAECIAGLSEKLLEHRFLTIVGPGGIGKTTVAVNLAHELYEAFGGAVYFVDLAPLRDSSLLPIAVANAFGAVLQSTDAWPAILTLLRHKRALVVFDNCEHLIESMAVLAERLFNHATHLHILTTSRETLQIECEQVYWLQPLESPPSDLEPDAEAAMGFSSVQLFTQRASASSADFRLNDADAPIVASICRKLDGIPLAIEIVARRVQALELKSIEGELDDRMKLSWQGYRTAFRRHQTLEATVDWSYNLLSETERLIFSRLAVFAGSFSLDAARAIAVTDAEIECQLLDALESLVSKSMMIVVPFKHQTRYRLISFTRAYAWQKLAEQGECQTLQRRYALLVNQLLIDAQIAAKTQAGFSWQTIFDLEIHNVRTALDWSATAQGDADMMIELTVNALSMLTGAQMYPECQIRCEQLLNLHGDRFQTPTVQESRVLTSLTLATTLTKGFEAEGRALSSRGLDLARLMKDEELEVMASYNLYVYDVFGHSATAALETAKDFLKLAKLRDCTPDVASAHRMIGGALLYRGELEEARYNLDLSAQYYGISGTSRGGISHFDGPLQTRARQAENDWLLGALDKASADCEVMLQEALAHANDRSCFSLLVPSIPMAMYMENNLTNARRRIALLTNYYLRFTSGWGKAIVEAFEAAAEIVCGNDPGALRKLAAANEGLRKANATVYLMQFLGTLAEGFGRAGRLTEAHAALDEAMAASQRGTFIWWRPELLRIRGNLLAAAKTDAAALRAEQYFREAIELAGAQSSLWLQLRGALELARFDVARGHYGEALAGLAQVYERFTEGFDFFDLREARALLAKLRAKA
jgi:predicted ATPase/DNA-binding winged helix-turn-helix (wHTH) protein